MMILSLTVAVLMAGGVYLLLQRSMVRAVFGLTLITHAINLALLITGVPAWRGESILDTSDDSGRIAAEMGDPLPQAFVLTAIVISLAATIFMLALAVIGRNDDMSEPPEAGEPRDDEDYPAGAQKMDAVEVDADGSARAPAAHATPRTTTPHTTEQEERQ